MLSLIIALNATAAVPKTIDCTYKIYSCVIVNGQCFGPPPALQKLASVPLEVTNPTGGGNDFEGELKHEFSVNGIPLDLDVKAGFTINRDGTVPKSISLAFTDPATGLTVGTGGDTHGTLEWSVKGAREWIDVWCSLN